MSQHWEGLYDLHLQGQAAVKEGLLDPEDEGSMILEMSGTTWPPAVTFQKAGIFSSHT
jgi:hypothetical protein